jgi:tRNA nucleotidyltransferase (CCA-adding enzyme)
MRILLHDIFHPKTRLRTEYSKRTPNVVLIGIGEKKDKDCDDDGNLFPQLKRKRKNVKKKLKKN